MQFTGKVFRFIAIVGLLWTNMPVMGQNVNAQDMSQLRIDDLSDEQIRSYMQQAESSGMSESQMLQMASARGMQPTEIEKLRQRVAKLQAQPSSKSQNVGLFGNNRVDRKERTVFGMEQDSLFGDTLAEKTEEQLVEEKLRAKIYGADLFMNANPRFEPNLNVATPLDYVIGAQDQLQIDIYGNSEASYNLDVTSDGNINIPYVGIVQIGGSTIEEATIRIKNKMSTVYSAMRSGATKLNVSLGNIRTIKVIITGEVVKPGTFSLPSVATVFNALYSAGGPTSNGSLRSIKIMRAGKLVADLDLYDFLQNGKMDGNINLRDQDIIQVMPYQSRVELMGEVKRPKLFETKPGETFEDLLRYAGGFTENAYQARVSVVRNTNREHRLEDVLESQYTQFEPKSGDKFTVERVLNRFANRVIIEGAVFRPGQYELSTGLTLSMLIKKADGIKEDAFMNRGYITRLKDDFQREQVSFDVAKILAGTQQDIVLKREDMVVIPSLFDLREEYKVEINGEVRTPGKFDYAEGMTLEELIIQAGGFTESGNSQRIEVARRVVNSDNLSESARTAEVFNVDVDKGLSASDAQFILQPFDLVSVRASAGYERQRTVRIEGEVLYPGEYTLTRKDERISDIIRRVGGFTPYAYVDGASLKRKDIDTTHVDSTSKLAKQDIKTMEELQDERMDRLLALQMGTPNRDASTVKQSIRNNYVGINLPGILKHPGDIADLILEEGDVLRVPKQLQTVRVSGEVLSPVTAVYNSNKGFKQYISQAGGFTQRALRKRTYVVYANGSARSTSRFLFFNNYPKVKPGSEIFVPQKLERERLNAAQWVGLGSGIATALGVIVALFR